MAKADARKHRYKLPSPRGGHFFLAFLRAAGVPPLSLWIRVSELCRHGVTMLSGWTMVSAMDCQSAVELPTAETQLPRARRG